MCPITIVLQWQKVNIKGLIYTLKLKIHTLVLTYLGIYKLPLSVTKSRLFDLLSQSGCGKNMWLLVLLSSHGRLCVGGSSVSGVEETKSIIHSGQQFSVWSRREEWVWSVCRGLLASVTPTVCLFTMSGHIYVWIIYFTWWKWLCEESDAVNAHVALSHVFYLLYYLSYYLFLASASCKWSFVCSFNSLRPFSIISDLSQPCESFDWVLGDLTFTWTLLSCLVCWLRLGCLGFVSVCWLCLRCFDCHLFWFQESFHADLPLSRGFVLA